MGETENLRAKAQIAARVATLGTTGCVIISRDGRVLTTAYDRDDLDAELIALLQLGDHQNCAYYLQQNNVKIWQYLQS